MSHTPRNLSTYGCDHSLGAHKHSKAGETETTPQDQ